MIRKPALAATILAISASPAWGDVPEFCTQTASRQVDTATPVDRERVAIALLDTAKVPIGLAARVATLGPVDKLSPYQSIVTRGSAACNSKGQAPRPGQIQCTDPERDTLFAVTQAYMQLDSQLDGMPADKDDISGFFSSGGKLTCKPLSSAQMAAVPGKKADGATLVMPVLAWENFRVRGKPADIIIDHGGTGYSDAANAKLSFGGDSGGSSKSLIGTIGYAIPIAPPADQRDKTTMALVPFFGVDLEETRKGTDPKKVSSNTITTGAAFQYQHIYTTEKDWGAWYIGVSPETTINYEDGSEVVALNLLYRPAGLLTLGDLTLPFNRTEPIGGSPTNNSPIGWRLIFDVRSNNGIFTRCGTRAIEDSRDFSRIGGRAGIGFSSLFGFPFPTDVSLTDTYMIALAGYPRHLSELDGDLTFYLNDDKIFGVTVSYARGRIEDLDARNRKWSIGLSAKY